MVRFSFPGDPPGIPAHPVLHGDRAARSPAHIPRRNIWVRCRVERRPARGGNRWRLVDLGRFGDGTGHLFRGGPLQVGPGSTGQLPGLGRRGQGLPYLHPHTGNPGCQRGGDRKHLPAGQQHPCRVGGTRSQRRDGVPDQTHAAGLHGGGHRGHIPQGHRNPGPISSPLPDLRKEQWGYLVRHAPLPLHPGPGDPLHL